MGQYYHSLQTYRTNHQNRGLEIYSFYSSPNEFCQVNLRTGWLKHNKVLPVPQKPEYNRSTLSPNQFFPRNLSVLDVRLYLKNNFIFDDQTHTVGKEFLHKHVARLMERTFPIQKWSFLKEAFYISPKVLLQIENQLHSSTLVEWIKTLLSPMGTGWFEAVAYGWLLKQIKIKLNRNSGCLAPEFSEANTKG